MAILTDLQIKNVGFASYGNNLKISDKASFYNPERVHIGSNVRIDDFCVVSAGEGHIYIGDYIHIAVFSSLIGSGKIEISDFCNISSRVSIYSSSDDFSGRYLTSPVVPSEFTNVLNESVVLNKHVIVGTGSVILPGVTVGEGVAIGAISLVKSDCEDFHIYAGVPATKIKMRSKELLTLEESLKNQ